MLSELFVVCLLLGCCLLVAGVLLSFTLYGATCACLLVLSAPTAAAVQPTRKTVAAALSRRRMRAGQSLVAAAAHAATAAALQTSPKISKRITSLVAIFQKVAGCPIDFYRYVALEIVGLVLCGAWHLISYFWSLVCFVSVKRH